MTETTYYSQQQLTILQAQSFNPLYYAVPFSPLLNAHTHGVKLCKPDHGKEKKKTWNLSFVYSD